MSRSTRATEGSTGGGLLSVRDAAAFLGITEKSVRHRVARGSIPFRRWGGRVVIPRVELIRFLEELDGTSAEQAAARSRGEDSAA